MQKWEYKVDYDQIDDTLNEHGQEGWELVAIATVDNTLAFYFKRPYVAPVKQYSISETVRVID